MGDIGKASLQEKINKSLSVIKALEDLNSELLQLGWEKKDADIFCDNLKRAISHAAYVMQSLRSKMGDVHGSKPHLVILAFDSLKWAMIVSSLLRE